MPMVNLTPKEIIDYWFSARIKQHWFSSVLELDDEIRDSYATVWEKAAAGDLDGWADHPDGSLALIIILDQFPLNMFRGEAKCFSTESKVIDVARHAIDRSFDERLPREQLAFLFMPFMHSERLEDQDLAVSLYRQYNLEANISFAEHHQGIVRRFERFPHRNAILGRESTADEISYLASDGAFKG